MVTLEIRGKQIIVDKGRWDCPTAPHLALFLKAAVRVEDLVGYNPDIDEALANHAVALLGGRVVYVPPAPVMETRGPQ